MNAWEWIQSDPEVDWSQIYPVPCKRGLNEEKSFHLPFTNIFNKTVYFVISIEVHEMEKLWFDHNRSLNRGLYHIT